MKVLALGTYDAILGMDWLKAHSPMQVDWRAKCLEFSTSEGTVCLRGHESNSTDCFMINSIQLQSLCKQQAITHIVQICATTEEATFNSPVPEIVQQVIDAFPDVFGEPTGLPPRRPCDHCIPLIPGAQPVTVRPYRHKPEHKDEIEKQVMEMLKAGIIQRSSSPFSSPVILVKKKDGTWRLCVDYRHLNALTCVAKFPIPIIEELLDELHGAKWFLKLDLRSGYHQIRLAEGEEYKTAFQTHFGHFEFKVLSFGLAGGPATFNGGLTTTLHPLLRHNVLVFFDDILVFSESLEEHVQDVKQVLQLLQHDNWKVKSSKCTFGQQQVVYLGHVVSAAGVATDPSKIAAVAQWQTPSDVKGVRRFLGLAGYYRRFVRNFGVIARPLFNLLKKGVPFLWTSSTETTFQLLKQQLTSAPVLALPDFKQQFTMETDACDTGVGAVLQQKGHPIAFISKALSPRYQGLSTYEKEYLAIIVAVEQWRPYLQHAQFIIQTDQRSLVHLEQQRLSTPWQQKAFTKLLGLRYQIKYKKGSDNQAADALTRATTAGTLTSITSCQPTWMDDLVASYNSNPQTMKLLEQLAIRDDPKGRFTLQQGVLRFRGRIWLGGSTAMQQQIIAAFHDSALGGHSGFAATYSRIRRLFAWPKMKIHVKNYVKCCTVCQRAKPDRAASPGLLLPLPIPRETWETISMDFIDGLPQSGASNCLLVIVDTRTKFAHFLPLAHPYTAAKVAQLYMHQVYRIHGFPAAIVSDRDPVFTSHFWQELFKYAGTELRMSTANHPQKDDQTERVNQCLETFLCCFTHACPRRWRFWTPLAQFWYNTTHHSAIGMTPFKAMFGYEPRHWGLSAHSSCSVPSLQAWLEERTVIQQLVQQHLNRAKQCMKAQADKKRSERQFECGDQVFVKLQPYIQSSVTPRANHKLSFKYYGPYQVIQRINDVAYKLQLPEHSAVHPVFHVSQLRKALTPGTQVHFQLPLSADALAVPVEVLNTRWRKKNGAMIEQVQVRWSGDAAIGTTWEDKVALQARFPNAEAWGQASSQGEGDVSAPSVEDPAQDCAWPSRARKPNSRVTGSEWVTATSRRT